MGASTETASVKGKPYGMGGFWALIVTQFQGAFNDNLFQYLVQFTMLAILAKAAGKLDEAAATSVPAIATVIFSLPFLIFPGIAGALSDRLSKQRIAVYIKYWEIFIVCFGFFAFWLQMPMFLWVMLFFMATHSAFFSPAKYGILPEILPENRLSWGNGILQMFTIIAIIAGTACAGPIHQALHERVHWATGVLLGLSCFGLFMAHFISKPPPANPRQRITMNPWAGMGKHFKIIYQDPLLLNTVVGYTYFWFAGALIRANVLTFGAVNLGLGEAQISYVLASMALGIGVGALSAGYLSRGAIELGLVPIGTAGMALFSALLAWPGFSYATCLGLLFGLGFFAGFFDVPLAATLQHRSPNELKGGIMATTNMLTFVGMLFAGVLYWVLGKFVSSYSVFLLTAGISLVVGLYMCVKLPFLPLRSAIWLIRNTLYRIDVTGREHVPISGGGLIVGNHTSFIDPGVVSACVDRPVRFVVFRGYYDRWWLRPFANIFGAIPVAAKDGPMALKRSIEAAREAIRNGELLFVMPEGEITRTGQLLTFRRGVEQIMKGQDAPIIPMFIDNLWHSLFGFSKGRFFWKWPQRRPRRIGVKFGPPLPPDTPSHRLRSIVEELGAEAYAERALPFPLLHRGFIRQARRHPLTLAVADARTGALSYLKALAGSIVLARKLKPLAGQAQMVGVLVPPSVGGALTNFALQIMGKVPVNLNYTASPQTIASCAERCGITHCITAHAFLERLPVAVPGQPVYLEDILKTVKKSDRIAALLLALLCPTRWLERMVGAPPNRSSDDLATVIFSSGSEGEPKGVMLSHRIIIKNIGSMEQIVPYQRGDVMMGFLPYFHSFGFVCLMWAPLTHGMAVVYHPSPLEAKAIGQLVRKYKAFFLVGTSTFLQNFIRRCTKEDFESLTFVLSGAEKLPPRVRDAFLEKFDKEPLDGYGATECGPGISANRPDFHGHGIFQRANKRGTVGRPMPGIAVRVVDPDTGAPLGVNEPGMLHVRSASLMMGYLGMPEKTASVLHDRWYITGDIGSIDEEGFITISDRLSRFSKVAGEMISHTKVEDTLHNLLGLSEQAMAVASVPDETRGERLVVLHTLTDEQLAELFTKMETCDLPNLWRPRSSSFHRIDAIPVLGTGKLDLKAVKALAQKLDLGNLE